MIDSTAWQGKKREQLAKIERQFRALLQTEKNQLKLADAADQIRAAQIRVLKARRAKLVPSERNAIAVAHRDREIAYWLGLTAGQIIEGYRRGSLGAASPRISRGRATSSA